MREGYDYEPGYKKLRAWQNAAELRAFVYRTTARFPRHEYRRVSQMRDAARSAKQNIQEGYKGSSVKKYMQAVTVSQGSLGELLGDWEDCLEDQLITKEEFETGKSLCGRTDYLLQRLLQALAKKDREGSWKTFRHLP